MWGFFYKKILKKRILIQFLIPTVTAAGIFSSFQMSLKEKKTNFISW